MLFFFYLICLVRYFRKFIIAIKFTRFKVEKLTSDWQKMFRLKEEIFFKTKFERKQMPQDLQINEQILSNDEHTLFRQIKIR